MAWTKTYFQAWKPMNWLFRPRRDGYRDVSTSDHVGQLDLIGQLGLARVVLGYGFWSAITFYNLNVPPAELTGFDYYYALAPYWVPALTTVAVAIFLLLITEWGKHIRTLKAITIPIGVSLYVIALLAIGASYVLNQPIREQTPEEQQNVANLFAGNFDPLALVLACLVFLLVLSILWWPFWFTLAALVRIFMGQFRAMDGHPYLASLSCIASVVAIKTFGYLYSDETGVSSSGFHVSVDAPGILQLAGDWGGPVILLVLSAYEIRCLGKLHLTVRGGSVGFGQPRVPVGSP